MSKKTTAAETAAPAPAPAAPDEHAGKGGAYEIVDGQRVLVERTQPRPEPGTAQTL